MADTLRYLPPVERKFTIDRFTHADRPALSMANIEDILAQVSYKPEWWLVPHGIGFAVRFNAPDTRDTSQPAIVGGAIAGPFVSEEHLIDSVGQTICNMEDHEFKEWFRYQGQCVLQPHPELQT